MFCLRCVRRALPSLQIRTSPSSLSSVRPQLQKTTTSQTRSISLLTPRRPTLLPSATTPATTTPTSVLNAQTLPSQPLDLMTPPSSHPSLTSQQLRFGPRDTFNPSHKVRKRRHGFLSRIKTQKGRATLNRRRAKGRKNLSH